MLWCLLAILLSLPFIDIYRSPGFSTSSWALWTFFIFSLSAQSLLSSWWYWFLYGRSSTIDAFRYLKEFIFQITSWTQKKICIIHFWVIMSPSRTVLWNCKLPCRNLWSQTYSSSFLRTWLLVYLLSYPRKIYTLSVLLFLQSVNPLWLCFLSPIYIQDHEHLQHLPFSPSLISQ